jgi:hypothetical protein
MLNITFIREKCASQTMETPHGIEMQQEFYQLCDLYTELLGNDKVFCKVLEHIHQFLNDLKINEPYMLKIECYELSQCLFKLSKMPIGFAKKHEPYYVIIDAGKRVEVPFEVITFSAYERLVELHYDLTDYFYLTILGFSGFKMRHFWRVDEIHKTSVYKDSL